MGGYRVIPWTNGKGPSVDHFPFQDSLSNQIHPERKASSRYFLCRAKVPLFGIPPSGIQKAEKVTKESPFRNRNAAMASSPHAVDFSREGQAH
jgi:hypothetical protein